MTVKGTETEIKTRARYDEFRDVCECNSSPLPLILDVEVSEGGCGCTQTLS